MRLPAPRARGRGASHRGSGEVGEERLGLGGGGGRALGAGEPHDAADGGEQPAHEARDAALGVELLELAVKEAARRDGADDVERLGETIGEGWAESSTVQA